MNTQQFFLIIVFFISSSACAPISQDVTLQPPSAESISQTCGETWAHLCSASEENCFFQFENSGCTAQRCVPKGECTQQGGEAAAGYPFAEPKQTQNITCKAAQELCLRYDNKIKKYIAACVPKGNCIEQKIHFDK